MPEVACVKEPTGELIIRRGGKRVQRFVIHLDLLGSLLMHSFSLMSTLRIHVAHL